MDSLATPRSGPRRVVFALFPGCEVLDVAGPLQAFHEANAYGGQYVVEYAAATPSILTAQGLEISSLAPLPNVSADDRVVVPGYVVGTTKAPRQLVAWLRRAADSGASMCSVCTGAFVLGDAGLLDGRRCTTHWRRVRELQERFPRATVVGDCLFVQDGSIITSAGIAAGIDMALAVLESDAGPVLASSVAREMVVYIRRAAGHHQDSVYLDYQTHLSPGVHQLQQFLVSHPESRASLAELGRIAGMSERNLSRVFRRATGISVHEYRERLRLERAQDLLRNPTLTLDAIASACGFADARQLRRVWTAKFGVPPRGRIARSRR
jgi:transcriptional regulator GlxA family with amidase domain